MSNEITIEYCPKCRWMIRAAWMQQELLVTFEEELEKISLKPSQIAGEFNIYLNNSLIYSRKNEGGFPELKTLKKSIRDLIAPNKSLGHSDA